MPLFWLRDIFIVHDVVLLYVNTEGWSTAATLATTFLLIIFRQFANLSILAMVLWGAWRMGRSVNLLSGEEGRKGNDEQALNKHHFLPWLYGFSVLHATQICFRSLWRAESGDQATEPT